LPVFGYFGGGRLTKWQKRRIQDRLILAINESCLRTKILSISVKNVGGNQRGFFGRNYGAKEVRARFIGDNNRLTPRNKLLYHLSWVESTPSGYTCHLSINKPHLFDTKAFERVSENFREEAKERHSTRFRVYISPGFKDVP